MKISVVGLGYVGAVTGACLAELGHEVVCVDLDERKVRQIQEGHAPIHEAGLGELISKHAGGRLNASGDLRAAILDSELTLIAVGTPFDGREIDLEAVRSVTMEIGAALRDKAAYHVVVVKSTVVPGTTRDVVGPLLEEASGKKIAVGMNPEFLTEGQAVDDFMEPDRLVLGGEDDRVHERLGELYAAFPEEIPRIYTNTTTAETIKYASNAMLATAISFANEIADLCASLDDADVVDVMRGVHLSRYLTPLAGDGSAVLAPLAAFFEAGCGFGGSCLPKDLRALVARGAQLGRSLPVLEATLETNDRRPDELVGVVSRHLDLSGARVTVLGLAFKPDTDDVRESPAAPIITRLLTEGAAVTVHDPVVRELPDELAAERDRITVAPTLLEAVRDADAIVLVTRWEEYNEVPRLLDGLEPAPLFVDGRRMLDKRSVPRYAGIGLAQ
jgi:UDPglucose 6-dehydrogenase/GDP-mannose 6-dehydrogenase